MKADKNFDFYEFAGIVMPGAILIFGLAQAETLIAQTIPLSDMSIGSLGVFLILAYAAGHLVQPANCSFRLPICPNRATSSLASCCRSSLAWSRMAARPFSRPRWLAGLPG